MYYLRCRLIGPRFSCYLKRSSKWLFIHAGWQGTVTRQRQHWLIGTQCLFITVRGLNMIEFGRWYRVTICKLLRALTHKKNTLWVQWIHSFDIKTRNLADMESPSKLLTCQKDVWCRTMAPQCWLYCTLESIFYSGVIRYQEAVLVINYSASQRSMEEPGSSHRNTTKTSVHSLACSAEQTGHSW